MCQDWWTRRQRRREDGFDQEVRYLFDEERRDFEPAAPVVEHERGAEPAGPERDGVEAVGLRS